MSAAAHVSVPARSAARGCAQAHPQLLCLLLEWAQQLLTHHTSRKQAKNASLTWSRHLCCCCARAWHQGR